MLKLLILFNFSKNINTSFLQAPIPFIISLFFCIWYMSFFPVSHILE